MTPKMLRTPGLVLEAGCLHQSKWSQNSYLLLLGATVVVTQLTRWSASVPAWQISFLQQVPFALTVIMLALSENPSLSLSLLVMAQRPLRKSETGGGQGVPSLSLLNPAPPLLLPLPIPKRPGLCSWEDVPF